MEFTKQFKQLEQYFDADKVIDTVEKNVVSGLTYVQPETVRDTLITLSRAQANFARANLVAVKSFGEIAKTTAEQFQANLKDTVNAK